MKTFKSYRTQRKRPQGNPAEILRYMLILALALVFATAGLVFLVSVIGR